MNRTLRSISLALLILAGIPACKMRASSSPVATLEVKAAIDSLWAGYAHASDRRDAAAFGALFTEDATLLYSGVPTVRGREAIQTHLASLYSGIDATGLRIVPDETKVSGSMAVQGGTFEESFLQKDKPMMQLGRFTLAAEMEGRSWKIMRLTAIVDSTVAAP